MRLILAAAIGALILDWASSRTELSQLRHENQQLRILLARHENARDAQNMALVSCRAMVDDHVMSAGQATVVAMNTDVGTVRQWRALRRYERSFPRVARSVGLQPKDPYGLLHEEGRESRLLVQQQEARFSTDRRSRTD